MATRITLAFTCAIWILVAMGTILYLLTGGI